MKNPITQLVKLVATRNEPKRSTHWPTVRAHHLRTEGWCRLCGGLKNLEVHHVLPFHIHPELELEDSNLITLCEKMTKECHLKHGHLGDWKNSNPDIRIQADHPAPKSLTLKNA